LTNSLPPGYPELPPEDPAIQSLATDLKAVKASKPASFSVSTTSVP
jgi:hypothetical protein